MISKKHLVVGLVVCCLTQMAFADDGLSKKYSVCMQQSGGITINMIDCSAAENKRQDARLNKAYKEVMAQLSPVRKKELQTVQRVWIKYRDANCDFYADPDGGTLGIVNANSCFLQETASRANELEGFMD